MSDDLTERLAIKDLPSLDQFGDTFVSPVDEDWVHETFALAAARIADLERQLAEAREVKPLEWVKHPTSSVWRCDTLIGTYKVFGIKPPVSWDFDGLDDEGISLSTSKVAQSVEAAKAAAQADYTARILSALKGTP